MGLLGNIAQGIRSLFRRQAMEYDMDDELREFIDASTAEKVRRGMPAEQATHAARVEMGSTNAVKHHIRSATWESRMEIFLRDLKHCVRGLLRSPGFTLIAVLSLALGIGANTAIFTLIKQVLLQDLPVRDPQQLVTFGQSTSGGILGGIDLGTADMFTYDFARQLEAKPGPFQGVAAYSSVAPRVSVRVSNSGASLQIPASLVSGTFFNVLGATPLMGRTIAPFDAATAHSNAVAVVSYHFWQQSLSSDPVVIGKTISINATPFTVIGVMPEAFHGITQELEPPDIWVPITMVQEILLQPGFLEPRSFYFLHMVARRSPQSPLATDQAWLDHQVRDYVRAGEGASIVPARQQEIERITARLVSAAHGVSRLRSRYGDSLKILMAIVAVVLLIACANLANFLLARAIARQREVATRLALGSSRVRIIRQSLLEALLLSLSGGVFGLAFAFAATRTLIAFVAQGTANTPLDARPDSAILLFTLAVSVLAGLLFGLAPALHGSRSSAMPTLNASTRTATGSVGRTSRWWPKALVTAQIMFCLLLLVGAGLFLRTLRNLEDQDFGFERTHLLIAEFAPELAGYKPEQAPALNQRLIERLSAIPGVRSAALSAEPPISFGTWTSTFSLSGYTPAPKEDMGSVLNRVSGQYFQTAGISIITGRAIAPADTANSMKVAVINETIARRFFPRGDAIGHTLKIDIDYGRRPVADRRHRTRHQGRQPARKPGAHGLYSPGSGRRQAWRRHSGQLRFHHSSAHPGRPNVDHQRAAERYRRHRSKSADSPSPHHAGTSGDDDEPGDAGLAAHGHLRFARGAACGYRALWRDELQRRSPQQRNRHPHRSWRNRQRRAMDGAARVAGIARSGPRAWYSHRSGGGSSDSRAALPYEPVRSSHLHWSNSRDCCGYCALSVAPRAPSRRCRSHDCVAM